MAAVTRFDSVASFLDRALPFLLQREAEHNLFLGICAQIEEGRYADPYLATVEDGDRMIAAAFRTPPHQVGISHVGDQRSLHALARDVHEAFGTIPGVLAAKEDARRFADIWTSLTGAQARIRMEQRIYEATGAATPTGVPGELRTATEHQLLIDWFTAFSAEAGTGDATTAATIDYRLDPESSSGQCWWWHGGGPVSLVGYGGPTPNGIRIGPVYTPPELRGRGYASACVAAVTRQLLDQGRRFCFLYTDLSNPTSNSIYQKIGYRRVCDVDQYTFE